MTSPAKRQNTQVKGTSSSNITAALLALKLIFLLLAVARNKQELDLAVELSAAVSETRAV